MQLTSFKNKSTTIRMTEGVREVEFTYNFVSHSTKERKTIYDFDVIFDINTCRRDEPIHAKIDIGEFKGGKTVDESLDKLAEWCERAAEAIRSRKKSEFIISI